MEIVNSKELVTARDMPEPYVDAEVASHHLSVARKTLNEMARTGQIPAYPWGVGTERRCWRFKLSELDTFMKSRIQSASRPLLQSRRKK